MTKSETTTPVEADPVAWQWLCKSTLGYRDRWVNCEGAEDAASKSAAGIEVRALYLAKPASVGKLDV